MTTRQVRLAAALFAAVLLSRCAGCGTAEEGCPSGQVLCGGFCMDPGSWTTAQHCGGCGISCGAGTCVAGADGWACDCGAEALCPASNPRCSDLTTDPANCGGCGLVCNRANESCVAGTCQCAAPFPDRCGTVCTNVQNGDRTNCGSCGFVCGQTNGVCVDSTCGCPATLPAACGTRCVALATDASNCGACGNACPLTNEVCNGGTCECPATLPDVCGSTCVDTGTDLLNCGACWHACPTGASCASGSCPCPAGPVPGCGGSCCLGGTACCGTGNACQTQHSNGLGQHFYDCQPLYTPASTTTLAAAQAAALAWAPLGSFDSTVFCEPSCVAIRPAGGSACAVWCYGQSNLAGRAKATDTSFCQSACPYSDYGTWE